MAILTLLLDNIRARDETDVIQVDVLTTNKRNPEPSAAIKLVAEEQRIVSAIIRRARPLLRQVPDERELHLLKRHQRSIHSMSGATS